MNLADPIEPERAQAQLLRRSDVGNAQRFLDHFGGVARYVHKNRRWYLWDGKLWAPDETLKIRELAKETVRRIEAEAVRIDDLAVKNAIYKHCLASETSQNISDLIEMAKSLPPIAAVPEDFDKDKMLLNCQNGTIDLRTGTRKPHDKGDFTTKILYVAFDPDAKAPRFEQFLDEIFLGDAEMIHYHKKCMGYFLTGEVKERCLFFYYGAGNNGKGKMTNVLLELCGPYASRAPLDFLMKKRNQDKENAASDLEGKRLAIGNEVEKEAALAEALAKDWTGGDKRMKGRRLYCERFDFDPQMKFVLYGNHKPRIKGRDPAIWRRVKLIPFDAVFEGEREDQDLGKKLSAELPGILAIAVRGCLDWQKEGLAPEPSKITGATAQYRADMDEISEFVAECLEASPDDFATVKDVYAAYRQFNGVEDALGKREFNDCMEQHGFEKAKGSGNKLRWVGVRLKKLSS